ncbi:hypothetical protein [Nocardia sp. NPDC050406]|uniref:hypothetical protein n=1 Tax=Nocardia sp. NPDC050406 TaxID=3364318 RepID=UPI0037A31AD6
MRFNKFGVFAGLAACVVGAVGAAPTAEAAPPGFVTCFGGPVESRVEAECGNSDVGAATAGLAVLCSNLRYLVQHERMAGESTVRLVQDCGAGAVPVWWTFNGETDFQQNLRSDG